MYEWTTGGVTAGWTGWYQHQIVRSSAEMGQKLLSLANRAVEAWLLGTRQGGVDLL
jgi:hypothetical protein